MNRLLAELLGTFCIVLAGTGAIVVDQVSQGRVTHVGVSLTFGLVVMSMIYAFADVSGAHFNPAVTLGLTLAGRFSAKHVTGYILAQVIGAMLASGVLRLLFPASATLGSTNPTGPVWQSFTLEVLLTFILMLVILQLAAKERTSTAGLVVGSVIAFEALFAGPISGASMNPARSLSPAIISGTLQHLWVYLLAPVIGAVIGVLCFVAVNSQSSVSQNN